MEKKANFLIATTLTLLVIAINVNLFGQNHYFYEGSKIELEIDKSKIAINFKDGVSQNQIQYLIESETLLRSVNEGELIPNPNVYILKLVEGITQAQIETLLEELEKKSAIAFSSPVYKYLTAKVIPTNQFIVKFNDGVDISTINELIEFHQLDIKQKVIGLANTFVIQASSNALSLANKFNELPTVAYSEPNFIQLFRPFSSEPNDTHFANQWALKNTGQNGGTPGADINAPEGWDITTGGEEVVIAIIDEGVDTLQEDLQAKILTGYDATDGDNNQQPNSWDGHGTACAGIAAAVTNNSMGIAGVNWNAKILPIRIAYSNAPGDDWITENLWQANGILTAALMGADVLSNSWGGGLPSNFVKNAILTAKTTGRNGKGCVILFASGNDNSWLSYQAKLDEVIAVGATNEWDERKSPTSQDGETTWGSNFGPELDIVAPGVHIWTTDISGSGGYSTGNYFDAFNGTSAATPHVAGLSALILSLVSDLTSNEVQEIIEQGAEDMVGIQAEDSPGWDQFMGWGRINVKNSLNIILPDAIEVGGHISEIVVWDPTFVYLVTQDLYIDNGAKLTIPPGTIVKMAYQSSHQSKTRIIANGTLIANGTHDDPIIITSERDDSIGGDTNGDGGASSPATTDWGYIKIFNSASEIAHCTFKYGGYRDDDAGSGYAWNNYQLWIYNVMPAMTISNCTFEHAYEKALFYYDNQYYSSPIISNNLISDCPYGIYLEGNATTTATISNNIVSTTQTGISTKGATAQISSNTISGGNHGLFSRFILYCYK